MSDVKDKKSEPSTQQFRFFPEKQDEIARGERDKMRPLEENYTRPFVPYERCDMQMFRYYLCARNMAERHAKTKRCKVEWEDLRECKFEQHQNRRNRIKELQRASGKLGDRVPGLYGERFWLH